MLGFNALLSLYFKNNLAKKTILSSLTPVCEAIMQGDKPKAYLSLVYNLKALDL